MHQDGQIQIGRKSREPEFSEVPNEKFKHFAESPSMIFDLVRKMSAGASFCLASMLVTTGKIFKVQANYNM